MDVQKRSTNLWEDILTFGPINSNAIYLPTTQYFPDDPEKFRSVLTFVYSDIARRLNDKQIGTFDLTEVVNGQQWFTSGNPQIKRQAFRKVFEIGAIGSGATFTFAHGITGFTALTFTDCWGQVITTAATFNKRPVPYASATLVTDQIQLDYDDTNVRIINGATAPNITSGIVVLNYLKN